MGDGDAGNIEAINTLYGLSGGALPPFSQQGDDMSNQATAYGQESQDWVQGLQYILGQAAKTGVDVWRNKTLNQAGIDPATGKPYVLGQQAQQAEVATAQGNKNTLLLLGAGVLVLFLVFKD